MRLFLVLVDLQNDFLYDPQLQPSAGQIVAAAGRLLEGFRSKDLPLAHVLTAVDRPADNRMPHWKTQGTWKCVVGTDGFESPEELAPSTDEPVIRKSWFNAFTGTDLGRMIRDRDCDTLVVCGLHLHACVRETVMDAYSGGLTVIVAADAVGSYDPLHAAMSKEYLGQRAAQFRSVSEILQMLDGCPEIPGPRRLLRHRSPRDPETEGWEVPMSATQDVDQACERAGHALAGWKSTLATERASRLVNLSEYVRASTTELANLMAREVGKPVRQGLHEVSLTADMISAVVNRVTTFLQQAPEDARVRRVPLGVVGLVTPWNNPLYIPLGKIVPALLLGNTVVWKPSPQGQQTATKVMDLLRRAGITDGVVVGISGDAETAAYLMRMARVNAVSLTGSSEAGYAAQAIGGSRRIPVQAELGGNNASVIWRDADIDSAASRIASGAFGFAGQRCTANRRAIVHESIYDRFLDALLDSASGQVLGDPLIAETDIGPIISSEKCELTQRLIDRSRAAGARVLHAPCTTAGEVQYGRGSSYFQPSIVCCDDPSAEIVQEEAFAPILVIQRAENWEDAIEKCNGVRQGLVAALFSENTELQDDFIRRAGAGIVKINDSTAGAEVDVPFGGWKSSGVGPAEHGAADIEFYTRFQAIYR